MTTKHVPLDDISIDGGTQARAEIHAATVHEYAEAMTEGETLPPAVVFFDGAQHHLADGFHRLHANRHIGAVSMECEIRTGTLMDARLYAYGANKSHGLRRTANDKRKAVAGMLADFPDMSDRAIAKHVGVSHPFVAAVRSPAVAERQAGARQASAAKTVAQAPAAAPAPVADDVESDSTSAAPAAPASRVESDSTPPTNPQAERMAELEQMATELLEDNKSMSAVFEADDKLAAAVAEGKRLRAEIGGLRERINGLMGEKNEAIRLMKSWQKRAVKAEKALATAGAVE
jgi:hypothetical protein